jgi:hypothetical protein
LKDEPSWHEDYEKEMPVKCRTVIVDDAHRQENVRRVFSRYFKITTIAVARPELQSKALTTSTSGSNLFAEGFQANRNGFACKTPSLERNRKSVRSVWRAALLCLKKWYLPTLPDFRKTPTKFNTNSGIGEVLLEREKGRRLESSPPHCF